MLHISSYDEMIHMLDLKTIILSTVWRCLLFIGFTYDKNKKCYYTDGHKIENVDTDHNNRFLVLFIKFEKRAYCCVQQSETIALSIESRNEQLPRYCYHLYLDTESNRTREYHIDTHPTLLHHISGDDKTYGDNLSVRQLQDKNHHWWLTKMNIPSINLNVQNTKVKLKKFTSSYCLNWRWDI